MNSTVKWIKEHAKALAAAVGGALVTLIMRWVNGEAPWPQTGAEWRDAAIGAAVGGVLAWLPTNKITQKQLDQDPAVIGGVVVSTAPRHASPPPAAPSGKTPWS